MLKWSSSQKWGLGALSDFDEHVSTAKGAVGRASRDAAARRRTAHGAVERSTMEGILFGINHVVKCIN
jgi:hypothetical protein